MSKEKDLETKEKQQSDSTETTTTTTSSTATNETPSATPSATVSTTAIPTPLSTAMTVGTVGSDLSSAATLKAKVIFENKSKKPLTRLSSVHEELSSPENDNHQEESSFQNDYCKCKENNPGYDTILNINKEQNHENHLDNGVYPVAVVDDIGYDDDYEHELSKGKALNCDLCGKLIRNLLKINYSRSSSKNEISSSNGLSPLNGLFKSYMNILKEDYPIHKCVFENNNILLTYLLQRPPKNWKLKEALACKDKHGNTPLHLAVMLGRHKCVCTLLSHDAPVKVKNNDGWSPLAEAISYGNRNTITTLLRNLKQQSRAHMEEKRLKLINALKEMKDFYMEFKWDFQSWLPLVSRMLPYDICRLHKSGSSLRLDTTLVDFNDMRWERGDISFIFRGDKNHFESLTVMDNEYECYQHIRYEDSDIEDEVDVLMSTDIMNAQMSTKSINFTRAQSGWIFREDRKELVSGKYQCDLYTIQGLILKQRKRREHLSNEDVQKNRAMVDSLTKGRRSSINNINDTTSSVSLNTNNSGNSSSSSTSLSANDIPQRRSSLHPPPETTITWDQYITTPIGKCPPLGRPPVHKQSNKTFRATVAMSEDFPLGVDMLLNVLEVIAPFKHLNKLREFITLKLPPGFPVKVEIPILHTVSAKITFQKFEFRDISEKLFEIPSHYIEDSRRFPDL